MLVYFEVHGFKNFEKPISMDFRNVRDYKFNEKCVKDGVVKNAIIYGKNSVGKTNFGLAVFDIVSHLTANNVTPSLYDNYLYSGNGKGPAYFKYVFQFGQSVVTYEYEKESAQKLLFEKLIIDDALFMQKDYSSELNNDFSGAKILAPTLNYSFVKEDSVLKYILNNTALEKDHPLYLMMHFVSNMLWFRSLDENRYIGYKSNSSDFYTFLLSDANALQEFQTLLHTAGVNVMLHVEKDNDGTMRLYSSPENDVSARLPFYKTASSGTKALYTYFYWKKTSPDISMLFIDEFDAYYHFELAEVLQKELQDFHGQVITTSHNTNLLSNRIMRPDCYFILTKDKLVSFANATTRELREGHNLEKLFISGEFGE